LVFQTKLRQTFFGRPDADVAGVVEAGQVVQAEARRRNDADLKIKFFIDFLKHSKRKALQFSLTIQYFSLFKTL
jgi:hypothetical protein